VPVLLVLACGTVWLVVGRSLRSVDQIRGAVTAITSADLSQRVPEPGTDDEISRLARTMNDMLARLDEAAARQRRFVADASHELRSPLTAIRTGLEVGLAHPDRAPWPQIAGPAVRQAQRLEQLIAQLLVLAKGDAYQLAARRQPVDLGALLADLRAATPAPGISIDLSVLPATRTAGNPEDLSRMFRNLLDNAVRHARHRVLVTAAAGPHGVVIQITDDGPGIPEEERERVFDWFVRLDASREQASGSAGLGLAIAREIAAAHRATIVLTEARAAEPGRSSPWAAPKAREEKPRPVPYTDLDKMSESRLPHLGKLRDRRWPRCCPLSGREMCGTRLFLARDLALAGLPEPDLAAGQRILSGVDLGTPKSFGSCSM